MSTNQSAAKVDIPVCGCPCRVCRGGGYLVWADTAYVSSRLGITKGSKCDWNRLPEADTHAHAFKCQTRITSLHLLQFCGSISLPLLSSNFMITAIVHLAQLDSY